MGQTAGMLRRLSRNLTLPTRITLLRLFAIPVLWVLAFAGHPRAVGIGWAAAAATDGIDGMVARRTHTTTHLGSALDSLADHLLSASGFVWIAMLRPEFLHERFGLLVGCAAGGALALAVPWARFRRLADFHLYSAKAAAVVVTLFGISLLVLGGYSRPFLYFSAAVMYLAATETILVALTRRRADEHTGSIFLRRPRPTHTPDALV
jgi:CDP-diacylglycerol---glycerol-3-phosphate 3-phosphatidyltransferase